MNDWIWIVLSVLVIVGLGFAVKKDIVNISEIKETCNAGEVAYDFHDKPHTIYDCPGGKKYFLAGVVK